MIFKDIDITNFRGIKSAEIKGLSRINLFVGKNNCGKTSILEAIFLILAPSNPGSIIQIDNIRNLIHDEESDFSFPFYNFNYDNSIEINTKLHTNNSKESKRDLKILPLKDSLFSQNPPVAQSSISTSGQTEAATSTIDSSNKEFVNGLEFNIQLKNFHTNKKVYKSSIRLLRNSNAQGNFPAVLPNFQINAANDEAKEDFFGLFQQPAVKASFEMITKLNQIIIEKKKEELVDVLKEIDGKIIDIELGLKNMIYFDIGIDRLVPANLMGDGVLKILSIIINIRAAKDGVLIIDEIDNGLHYSSLKFLWQSIFKAAEQYNCQLFFTSHNFEVIKYLVEFLEEKEYVRFKSDFSCYSIVKNKKDEILASKYDFNKLEFTIENEIEIRGNNQ